MSIPGEAGQPEPDVLAEELRGIRAENLLIRDQIDALQVAAAERRRPWYRNPSMLLSIIALCVSTTFSAVSVYRGIRQTREEREGSNAEAQRAKLEMLRSLLVEVAELRGEETQEQATVAPANAGLFAARSAARNQRRQILLESADAAIQDVWSLASPQLFNSLANEHVLDSRFTQAERYLIQALATAKDSVNALVVANQGLGTVYMTPGSERYDVARGRESYAAALRVLARRNDEYAIQQRAHVLSARAWMERANGNTEAMRADLREARSQLGLLSVFNPARQQLLAALMQIDQDSSRLRDAAEVGTLPGSWRFVYPTGAVGRMEVIVTPTNYQWASVEVRQDSTLIKMYGGAWLTEAPNRWRIDWQGTEVTPTGAVQPLTGTTRVVYSPRTRSYSVIESRLGAVEVRSTLKAW